jgi:putative glutamine transport system permease protein
MNLQRLVDPQLWQPLLVPSTWSVLGRGLAITLQVTLVAAVLSMIFGTLLALLRLSRARLVHYPAVLIIEGIRALPVLFIIFAIWAIFLKAHLGAPLWISAAAGLTIYTSAVVAEIVRAGITSIEFGQIEAARALGLSYAGTMRFVVLPQALRRMVPPLVSQLITLLKDTSLAAVIGLNELLTQGQNLYRFYYNPLQMLLTVAAIYFVINFTLSRLSRRLEAARRQREPRVKIALPETEAAA